MQNPTVGKINGTYMEKSKLTLTVEENNNRNI